MASSCAVPSTNYVECVVRDRSERRRVMRCASLVDLAYRSLSRCADSQRSGKGPKGAWIATGRRDTPRGEWQEQI